MSILLAIDTYPSLSLFIYKKDLRTVISTSTIISTLKEGFIMDTMSYSAFRNHLASVLDKVNDDHKPVLITRQNGRPAVIISLEDFHAYEETSYLMASSKNAERLNQAIEQVESGQAKSHKLIEE